ncbi:MAG: hypothetical protein AAGC96_10015 [Pseudomonadota bacterium]
MLKAKNHFDSVRRIRLLYSKDEHFRAIWDDYLLVSRVMRRFNLAGETEKKLEYNALRGELVEEVRTYLKNSRLNTSKH